MNAFKRRQDEKTESKHSTDGPQKFNSELRVEMHRQTACVQYSMSTEDEEKEGGKREEEWGDAGKVSEPE